MTAATRTRPVVAGTSRGAKVVARETKSNGTVNGNGGASRVSRQTTLEDRLEGKAARGDRTVYTDPSLDEMSLEQRHKLLYGE